MKRIWLLFIIIFLMSGCGQTESSTELEVLPVHEINAVEVFSASKVDKGNNDQMTVREYVKGNDVYVECIISDFSFAEGDKESGYINLYLNGKKVDEIHTAAFIIKGLPTGNHEIKLELVNRNGEPYGIEKVIEVSIT